MYLLQTLRAQPWPILVLAVVIFAFVSAPVSAREQPPASPTVVRIGTYVQNILDLNVRGNSIAVDFYLWFRWTGDGVTPHESFEIVNGKVNSRTVLDTRRNGEMHFSQVRVNATLHVKWQLERFSLDRQTIPIIIEDATFDNTKIVYEADTPNISVRQSIEIPGYVIANQKVVIGENIYTTNFGDPDLPPDSYSTYSQYIHGIEIERPGYGFFLKLFSGMWLGVLLISFCFALKTDDISARIGFGVGAIFVIMSSNFSISGQLPPTHVFTLGDQMYFASMAMVVFSMILAVISWRAMAMERAVLAYWLDRLGMSLPIVYAILMVLIIRLASTTPA